MPAGRDVKVKCPKCESKMNYNKENTPYTKDKLIKCRVSECDYVFTREETDRIEDYLMVEWMKKTQKGESRTVEFR